METITTTNDLRYSINKIIGNKHIYVKIRLNDECNNGKEDFSITGDIYEAGKPKADKYFISGGCIHEEILKYFPEFEHFVRLHLSDYKGKPMYAASNGFYHLQNGFNSIGTDSPKFEDYFCEEYRLTKDQFNVLKTSQNKVQYFMNLESLKMFDHWKLQADEAIKVLEALTGQKFESKATRPDYERIECEALIAQETERIASGYYLPDAIKKRHKEAIKEKIDKLTSEFKTSVKELKDELNIKTQLFKMGGDKYLDGTIVYNHSKQVKFNWRGYGKPLSSDEMLKIKKRLKLPEGYTYEN